DYEKYNVSFVPIPLIRNNLNPIKEIVSIYRIIKILKKARFEAIILYGIRTFPTMILSSKIAGVKNIVSIVNGSGSLFKLKGIKGKLTKLISYPMLMLSFSLSNHIFIQNKDDLNLLKSKKLLLRNNYSKINGSGVNVEDYPFLSLEKQNIFTMISRLTGEKGVNEFLQAAKNVKKQFPETIFRLIGPIDNFDKTLNFKLLNDCINNNIVESVGEVEDVRSYLENTRVFVLTSYYPEGVPRSILEAMSMGRPIITTNSSGCKETVISNRNGIKIDPRDSLQLTKAMISMIKSPDLTEEMGIQSTVIAKEKFDVRNINNEMLKKFNFLG